MSNTKIYSRMKITTNKTSGYRRIVTENNTVGTVLLAVGRIRL